MHFYSTAVGHVTLNMSVGRCHTSIGLTMAWPLLLLLLHEQPSHHQSELVGDVAFPVSVHQVVLFCALRSPNARTRLNWRRSSSPSWARVYTLNLIYTNFKLLFCHCGLHGLQRDTYVLME